MSARNTLPVLSGKTCKGRHSKNAMFGSIIGPSEHATSEAHGRVVFHLASVNAIMLALKLCDRAPVFRHVSVKAATQDKQGSSLVTFVCMMPRVAELWYSVMSLLPPWLSVDTQWQTTVKYQEL